MDKGNPLYSFIAIMFCDVRAQLILVPLAQLTSLTKLTRGSWASRPWVRVVRHERAEPHC